MKTISVLLVAAIAVLATDVAQAKTFQLAHMSEQTLKKECKRGGGTYSSSGDIYKCVYQNGNVRSCSRSTGKCIAETPKNVLGSPYDDDDVEFLTEETVTAF